MNASHLEEAMRLRRHAIAAGFGLAVLFVLLVPKRAGAQAAPRSAAADAPSRNAETRVQHDSLAVHFLRTPKAKPVARTGEAARGAATAKFRGRAAPVVGSTPVATPLPTKRGSPKN